MIKKLSNIIFLMLFFSCVSDFSNSYETITLAGEKIQVAREDFPNPINFEDAVDACNGLGNGWRLPNIVELDAINEQLVKKGKGNFTSKNGTVYWSSVVHETGFVTAFNINPELGIYPDGSEVTKLSKLSRNHELLVRAVRSISN